MFGQSIPSIAAALVWPEYKLHRASASLQMLMFSQQKITVISSTSKPFVTRIHAASMKGNNWIARHTHHSNKSALRSDYWNKL
jgi:hypothetical protein